MPLVFSTIDSICNVSGYVALVGRLILIDEVNQDMLGLAAGCFPWSFVYDMGKNFM